MAELIPGTVAVAVPPPSPVVIPSTSETAAVAVVVATGPTGPPGSGSGGAAAYVHTQVLPSTVWDIAHGMGFRPAGIHVVDAENNIYYPEVTYLDNNTVRLSLPESILGTAYLS